MKRTLTLSGLVLVCALINNCSAMDQTNPAALQADIIMPDFTSKSLIQLAADYENFCQSQDPKELRLALFGVAGKLAGTPLEMRDQAIEANARAVYTLISSHYPSQPIRDSKFLYGIILALQKPATEDRHPFRQFYTPVEQLREVMKTNMQEQNEYQATLEDLARKESGLSAQMAALQAQLDDTRAKKQSQLQELTLIVQANHTLKTHLACHGIALQEHRNALKKTVIDTIDQFIDLKKKLADAAVAHEKTNYTEQLKPLPDKITADINSLWYCVHYLKRVKLPDGSFSTADSLKWKLGSVNPEELGITNYADYLKYKAQ